MVNKWEDGGKCDSNDRDHCNLQLYTSKGHTNKLNQWTCSVEDLVTNISYIPAV